MPKINFHTCYGKAFTVDANTGQSIMDVAREHDIPGIVAECGGTMSCATCHVYIPEDWLGKVGAASGDEVEMLELAVDPQDNSRLSCQVIIDDTLEGLVVDIPKMQF